MKNRFVNCMLLLACILGFASCNQKTRVADISTLASSFSELECRAYTLREQRYLLADKIRFAQDSMIKTSTSEKANHNLQDNLSGWLKSKDLILAQSLRLADTIKLQLDTIIKIKLVSQDKIKDFENALSVELAKRNCK